jgi:signal transduction histidine kinase
LHEPENKAYIILLIATISLLIILSGFFSSILKQKNKNRILYEEKINAEMIGREEERKRISKDLHDELGANLTGALMYLQSIQVQSDRDKEIVSNIHDNISSSLKHIREIMNDLHPISLDHYGLNSCLIEFIDEMNQLKNINIIFANSVDNLDQKVLSEHKIHIFRIIREITQNTIKHSKSPVLSIRIVEQMKKIVIETIDQGVGFDANNNSFRKKGHGINNIINRVELMNGSIFLDARLQKGVHFTIEIPI